MGGILESFNNAVSESLRAGSPVAIGIAFLFGVFVGFTPCVYPVLPLTVSYIGSISRGGRLNGFLFSLVYVLGMALVYCAVGIVTVLAGGFLGSLWSNGWLLLALANFFILLGLWQLGVIKVPVPQFLQRGGSRKGGALGALAVGAASGLVIGPCTLPGLAAMVALVQQGAREGAGGSVVYGVAVMFAYSLGLGSLVLICGTFSGLLASLPRSGRWLAVTEKVFAALMILIAEFFLIYLGQNARFPFLANMFPEV
jgi:thiol:disulfide interchange protein DsbD